MYHLIQVPAIWDEKITLEQWPDPICWTKGQARLVGHRQTQKCRTTLSTYDPITVCYF